MKRYLLPVLAASALATGCYTQGDVGVGYSYGYAASGPDLYYMSPGVSVVAYSEYPTFYSDNYYWRYQDGLWYRSGYYGGGWAVSYDVPYRVRSIDRPTTYTRFQPGRGWVRMHDGGGGTGYNANRSAPAPAYGGRARGGTTYTPAARGGSTYSPPARDPDRANGGVTTTPRGGGSGPTVRDHRRR